MNCKFQQLKTEPIYDDKELFLLISRGDEEAFTLLFHKYTPKLFPFVFKLTRSEHLAQEMIQETFLRLWVSRVDLVNIENPSAWIYRIASNLSINYLRNQNNRLRILQTLPIAGMQDTSEEKMDSKELEGIIRLAVNLLPEKRQEVYRLSREDGLSHQQIADKLNISINTVKNQIGSSLKFIQEFISKETGLSMITLMILFGR